MIHSSKSQDLICTDDVIAFEGTHPVSKTVGMHENVVVPCPLVECSHVALRSVPGDLRPMQHLDSVCMRIAIQRLEGWFCVRAFGGWGVGADSCSDSRSGPTTLSIAFITSTINRYPQSINHLQRISYTGTRRVVFTFV